MINKFADGKVPEPGEWDEADKRIPEIAREAIDSAAGAFDNLAFSEALEHIFRLVDAGNKYIDDAEPWILQRAMRAGGGLAPSSTIWPKASGLRQWPCHPFSLPSRLSYGINWA